jgi:glyoxylase-like metal-dependent hydrolase (beta-lactamase superfamily II)
MCLYEPEHRFLFSGDHILAGISSNITSWNDGNDYLGLYLQSLDKIYALDIKTVLPGHRSIIKDHRQRISELKHHHRNRLQEIKGLLQKGSMTAYEVASCMHWDIPYNSWKEFPRYQRWFATGEAIAHLEHLCYLGEAAKDYHGSQVVFSLSV